MPQLMGILEAVEHDMRQLKGVKRLRGGTMDRLYRHSSFALPRG